MNTIVNQTAGGRENAVANEEQVERDTTLVACEGVTFTHKRDEAPPVDRIEIKPQISSASNLKKNGAPYIGAAVDSKVMSHHNSLLLPKNVSESQSSTLMVQGSRMKRDEPKEISRVQSVKPVAEPLINKKEEVLPLYWRLNKDGTTIVLQQKPEPALNADLSAK